MTVDAVPDPVPPPPPTPEQTENETMVKGFVERYAKVRRPGVSLLFLKAFMQDTAADKVRQDAQSTFGHFSPDRLAALIDVTQRELEALEQAQNALKAEAFAKFEAEQKAAAEAKAAEKASAKEAAKTEKLGNREARRKKPAKK